MYEKASSRTSRNHPQGMGFPGWFQTEGTRGTTTQMGSNQQAVWIDGMTEETVLVGSAGDTDSDVNNHTHLSAYDEAIAECSTPSTRIPSEALDADDRHVNPFSSIFHEPQRASSSLASIPGWNEPRIEPHRSAGIYVASPSMATTMEPPHTHRPSSVHPVEVTAQKRSFDVDDETPVRSGPSVQGPKNSWCPHDFLGDADRSSAQSNDASVSNGRSESHDKKFLHLSEVSESCGTSNIAREFASLGLNHASQLIIESATCTDLYKQITDMAPSDVQLWMESKSMGLTSRYSPFMGQERGAALLKGGEDTEAEFRASLYHSMFVDPSCPELHIERVINPLHPTRLSTPIDTPVFTLRYKYRQQQPPSRKLVLVKQEEGTDYRPCAVTSQSVVQRDDDVIMDGSNMSRVNGPRCDSPCKTQSPPSPSAELQNKDNEIKNQAQKNEVHHFPLILGSLWGVIRDVSTVETDYSPVVVGSCIKDVETSAKRLVPRLNWLLGFRTGADPNICFCPTIKPQRQIMDCSQATTPVFFVNHFESLWGRFHREVLSYRSAAVPLTPMGPSLRRMRSVGSSQDNNTNTTTIRISTIPTSSDVQTTFPSFRQMFWTRSTSPFDGMEQPSKDHPYTGRRPNCRFHVVSVKGFPFFVLASIPGIQLNDGDELVIDKGEQWQQQRRRLDWPLLWNEFVSNRAPSKLRVGFPFMLNETQRWNFCNICYQPIRSDDEAGSAKDKHKTLICDGCQCPYHVVCIRQYDFTPSATVLPNIEWFCSKCRGFAGRVLGNTIKSENDKSSSQRDPLQRHPLKLFQQEGSSVLLSTCSLSSNSQPGPLLRGDESPLRHLKPCAACNAESSPWSRNINILCRLFKLHLYKNRYDEDDVETSREQQPEQQQPANRQGRSFCDSDDTVMMSTFIIETVTAALVASENRNFGLHRQLTELRNRSFDDNLNPQEVKIAIDFWRSTRQRFELFQQRQSQMVPDIPRHRPDDTVSCSIDTAQAIRKESLNGESQRRSQSASDVEEQVVGDRMSDDEEDEDEDDEEEDHHLHSRTRKPTRGPGRPPAAGHCRPQLMARCLLREEFEPDKAAACIDNPVSINEANATAKSLRPWPRGISWNSKRLTWSVRFWNDDGKTLVATSLPARKHGGVEEAFRKAVALRNRSFIHVLNRVASDCQAEGRDLDSLHWSHAQCRWRAKDQKGEIKEWSAVTEEEVKSTWRDAVQWLDSKLDVRASAIDVTAVERLVPCPITLRESRHRQSDSTSEQAREDREEDTTTTTNDKSSLTTMLCLGANRLRRHDVSVPSEPHGLLVDESIDADRPVNEEEDDPVESAWRQTSSAIASLQPFPRGLIWARTTNRFFAVFRDPQSSILNKKKRFKTFDPKKFGGLTGAFQAANEFLETVEPWETKSKGTDRRGSAIPKRRGRQPYLFQARMDLASQSERQVGEPTPASRFCDMGEAATPNTRTPCVGLSNERADEAEDTGGSSSRKGVSMMMNDITGSVLPVSSQSLHILNEEDEEEDVGVESMTDIDEEHQQTVDHTNDDTMNMNTDCVVEPQQHGSRVTTDEATLWSSTSAVNVSASRCLNTDTSPVVEQRLESLPNCDAIRWSPDEQEFISTAEDKRIKRFSPFGRAGLVGAWHEAFQWVEEQKEKIAKNRLFREKENGRQSTRTSRLFPHLGRSAGSDELSDNTGEENSAARVLRQISSCTPNPDCHAYEGGLKLESVDTLGVEETDNPQQQDESDALSTRIGRRSSAATLIQELSQCDDGEDSDALIPPKIRKRKRRKRKLLRDRETPLLRCRTSSSPLVHRFSSSNIDNENHPIMSTSEFKRRRCEVAVGHKSAEAFGAGVLPAAVTSTTSFGRLANYVRKIEDEHLYDSEDSHKDMNEQARRLEKFNNVSWVPQKQAFSVFYSKDVTAHNKTTKAFNPIYYNGVKRAYKQACIFGLRMMERKLLFNSSGSIGDSGCKTSSHNMNSDEDHDFHH